MNNSFGNENESNAYYRIYGKNSFIESKMEINDSIAFQSDILPIIESKYPNYHYKCPYCQKIPYIEIEDKENIFYICSCQEEKVKKSIKEIFITKEKYMTLFDDNDNNYNINKLNGFKCIHQNNPNQNKEIKKFRYYCFNCGKNICRKCIFN